MNKQNLNATCPEQLDAIIATENAKNVNETNLSIATKEEKIAKKSGLNVGDNGIPRINSAEDWKAYDKAAKEIQAEKTNDIKISKNENVLPQITTNMAHKDFATALYARSKNDEAKTGIPAIFMTAQACAESGYGNECPANNNIFCIRTSNWINYASVDEAIISYEQLLTSSTYSVPMNNLKENPNESMYDFATDIGKVYDPGNLNYAKNIQSVINLLNKWGMY